MLSSEMWRILVVGSGGAGKSMLARKLSKILRLPLINLDARYWRPGWVQTGKDERKQIVSELIKRDRWVIDGN